MSSAGEAPKRRRRSVRYAPDKCREAARKALGLTGLAAGDLPEYLTMTEAAQAVGYSRGRFYDLIKVGAFPPTVYLLSNQTPVYHRDLVERCRQTIVTRQGFNGQPVMLRKKGARAAPPKPKQAAKFKPAESRAKRLTEQLQHLGCKTATEQTVDSLLAEISPRVRDGPLQELLQALRTQLET